MRYTPNLSTWLKSLYLYTFYPVTVFYVDLLPNICNTLILKFVFFWKISNYADAYWFLYSNKKVIYEVRYL